MLNPLNFLYVYAYYLSIYHIYQCLTVTTKNMLIKGLKKWSIEHLKAYNTFMKNSGVFIILVGNAV